MKPATSSPEFTIDELAREAGTTVRNVRAYQEKGLLPPPEKRGRVGIYGNAHLARLRLISPLLERGYSLANVAELI
ncbi:MAG TPA: MerR family transcriptional regulator, partial [Rhizomicrobium sp.]|nr:MerR family transcriptional regulator [Rhizomicrobium sp.]